VFDYTSNYDNDTRWRHIVSITPVPTRETRAGTIMKEEFDFLGQRYVTIAKITRFEPGKRLVWEATQSVSPVAGGRLVEEENGGTRYTQVVTSDITGINRLFAPIMVRALRTQMRADITALKQLLE
jgi:hypothetical protein